MTEKVNLKKENVFKFITLTFCIGWFIVIHSLNFGPSDTGDGVMHFYISQASWTNPLLFLDHWGKPVFVLLSSSFAQFGLTGMIVFNIIVFSITVLFGWKILRHFRIHIGIQCLFPLLLISLYDYSVTVLAGLTEPLFSMLFMIATWFLISKNWKWYALSISILPFLRSEGQLAIVLSIFIFIYLKHYKYIPLLFTAFVLYGIIGFFALDDFWWYFTKSPYSMDNDIYGKGPWNDYLLKYEYYLGKIGLYIFYLSCLRIIYLLKNKQWGELEIPWLVLTYGLYLGIIFLHSYFWAFGLNGSCGLTRLATQSMPSFILINLYYIGKINYLPSAKNLVNISVGILITLKVYNCLNPVLFPIKIWRLDVTILKAADYLISEKDKGKNFFFYHPLFVLQMKENPLKENQNCVFNYKIDLEKDL